MYLIELKSTLTDSFERWTQTFGKLITMKEGWMYLKDEERCQGIKAHGQQSVDKALPIDKQQPRADSS